MPPSLPSYFSSGHRAALVLLPVPSSAARSMPRLSSGRLARRRSPTVPEAVGHGKRMGGGMPPWLHVEREPTLPIRPPQGCPPPPHPPDPTCKGSPDLLRRAPATKISRAASSFSSWVCEIFASAAAGSDGCVLGPQW
ncbi:unnamed protein product [Urochloa humidicola]